MTGIREYKIHVAGAIYRQDEIARCHEGHPVELVRNPENEYDENAIEVWAGDWHIGFIPRDQAELWAEWMDAGDEFDASILELVPPGRGRRYIGVVLEVLITSTSRR